MEWLAGNLTSTLYKLTRTIYITHMHQTYNQMTEQEFSKNTSWEPLLLRVQLVLQIFSFYSTRKLKWLQYTYVLHVEIV